jgi:hypothetical protein
MSTVTLSVSLCVFRAPLSPGVDEFQILNNHAAVVSLSKRDCSITAPSFEFDKATARLIY